MLTVKNKIKNMTLAEMLLSIDRLTRFKFPEIKYNRVFREIISKHLIEPKISFKEYENLNEEQISAIIEQIFNKSIVALQQKPFEDHLLCEYLKKEELNLFNMDKATQNLINTKIPYATILEAYNSNELCKNLLFLKQLCKNNNPKNIRKKHSTKFPIEKVVLAEGITEEILLPKFAKIMGYDFDKNGIEIIAAGGKNQVAKEYLKLHNRLNLPIIILLDADAKPVAQTISNKLREQDKLILIQKGEFEDILPLKLLKKAINYKFLNLFSLSVKDFSKNISRVKDLENIYRQNGLGEFKKGEFAHMIDIVLDLKSQNFVSEDIKNILKEIKSA